MKRLAPALVVCGLSGLLSAGGCGKPAAAPAPPPAHITATRAAAAPLDPDDPAWDAAPELAAPLIPQDLVDPRVLAPTTETVRVRALTDGRRLAIRLEWDDPEADQRQDADQFTDACAVQWPADETADGLPAPQMGEPGAPVRIAFWTAARQAAADGRPVDDIRDLYPNATVDHYPFEAPSLEPGSPVQQAMAVRYAPARAVGNPVSEPAASAVQDLEAEGPGTLRALEAPESQGRGARTDRGWAVVIARPLDRPLEQGRPRHVALAVWQGSAHEAGARKMRTGWIPLALEQSP